MRTPLEHNADVSTPELHQFVTLFHRMVDDFLAYDAYHHEADQLSAERLVRSQ